MNPRSMFFDRGGHDFIQQISVARCPEYRLPVVAPKGDVIDASRNVQAERACHDLRHLELRGLRTQA